MWLGTAFRVCRKEAEWSLILTKNEWTAEGFINDVVLCTWPSSTPKKDVLAAAEVTWRLMESG